MQIRDAIAEELYQATALALGSRPGSAAPAAHVEHFLSYIEAQKLTIGAAWVVLDGPRMVGASLAILTPGRIVMALCSPAPPEVDQAAAIRAALDATRSWSTDQGARLVQALVSPDDEASLELLEVGGFEHLANLRYLSWHPPRHWRPPALTIELVPRTTVDDVAFRNTLAATYVESRDCPRLVGLREMDDVLVSHRATGIHDPALWLVAREDSKPVGVLLLSRVPLRNALEIVYTGIVPGARGAGLGRQLVGAAQRITIERECEHLLLAVDEENQFALNIYVSLGFATTEKRSAWISVIDDVE